MSNVDTQVRIAIALATGMAFLLVTLPVHAQTDTAPTRADRVERMQDARAERVEARDERRSNLEAAREERTAAREERRGQLQDAARDRIKGAITKIKERMENAVTRLGGVADRIESRAEKLEERGVDVSEVLTLVREARAEIDEAALILRGEIDSDTDAALDSDTPREAFAAVKTKIRDVQAHLKSAREALRLAVSALKEAVREAQSASDEVITSETDEE